MLKRPSANQDASMIRQKETCKPVPGTQKTTKKETAIATMGGTHSAAEHDVVTLLVTGHKKPRARARRFFFLAVTAT